MEEKKELQELLVRLDESNRKQAAYAKWQCVFFCCCGNQLCGTLCVDLDADA